MTEYKSADNEITMLAFRQGLTLAGINIIWSLATFVLGAERSPSVINSMLSFGVSVISVILLVQGIKAVRNMQNGRLSFGQGIKTGTMISVVAAVSYGLYMYLYFKFINPDIFSWLKEESLREVGSGEMELAENMMNTILSPVFMSILITIFYIMGGFILSLLVSALYKSESQDQIGKEPYE